MPILEFPTDRIVGTVEWDGSWTDERGPVLATGSVEVPDDVMVSLDVSSVLGSEPRDRGGWTIKGAQELVDLSFLSALPDDRVESLSIRSGDESTFGAVAHLAPSLRRLYLEWADFTDAVLDTVATLTGLVYLQSFGNRFTDHGVQQLATLVHLEALYLEEESLTAAAFHFVDQLPRLVQLGVQDVSLSDVELRQLRDRLPGVSVG